MATRGMSVIAVAVRAGAWLLALPSSCFRVSGFGGWGINLQVFRFSSLHDFRVLVFSKIQGAWPHGHLRDVSDCRCRSRWRLAFRPPQYLLPWVGFRGARCRFSEFQVFRSSGLQISRFSKISGIMTPWPLEGCCHLRNIRDFRFHFRCR